MVKRLIVKNLKVNPLKMQITLYNKEVVLFPLYKGIDGNVLTID